MLNAGYISNASPESDDDGNMWITVEFVIAEGETQTVVFNFDTKEDFVKGMAYWAFLLKAHAVALETISDLEEFEEKQDWRPDTDGGEVSNPFFNMRHAAG